MKNELRSSKTRSRRRMMEAGVRGLPSHLFTNNGNIELIEKNFVFVLMMHKSVLLILEQYSNEKS